MVMCGGRAAQHVARIIDAFEPHGAPRNGAFMGCV